MQDAQWILVVDADPKAVEECRSALVARGLNVESASNVAEAAEKLKLLNCCCLIIDVDLPQMKGYEAVPILRAIEPDVKVIMTASTNTRDLETRIRQQDVFYYHIKSFSSSELASAVADALQACKKSRNKVS